MAVYITPPALIAVISQAVEVFRQETYGYLLVSEQGKNQKVVGAISYQTAKRNGYNEVEDSVRAERVFKWTSQITGVMDGFHSHTYSPRQKLCAKPTESDIKNMTTGHIEIIVALQKTRRNYTTNWREDKLGLRASINGYRFLVRCWEKINRNKVKEIKIKALKGNTSF